MKTENYKGIDIFFNSTTKRYYTKALVYKRANNRCRGYISLTNPADVRKEIDLFLKRAFASNNIASVFIKGKHYDKGYSRAQVLFYDKILNAVTVIDERKKINTIALSDYRFHEDKIFINDRKNRLLVHDVYTRQAEIIRLKNEIASLSAKLVPLKSNRA